MGQWNVPKWVKILTFLYRFSDVKLPTHGFSDTKIRMCTYCFSQKSVHVQITYVWEYPWMFACLSTHVTVIHNFGAWHSFDATIKYQHWLEQTDVIGWCYTVTHWCYAVTYPHSYATALCYMSVPTFTGSSLTASSLRCRVPVGSAPFRSCGASF